MPTSQDFSLQTDDWTTVTDPLEKKRIQNRVAQRTYRHRMRTRLRDLEQQVQEQQLRTSPHASSSATNEGATARASGHRAIVARDGHLTDSNTRYIQDRSSHQQCSEPTPLSQQQYSGFDASNHASSEDHIVPDNWSTIDTQQMAVLDCGDMSFNPDLMEGNYLSSALASDGRFLNDTNESQHHDFGDLRSGCQNFPQKIYTGHQQEQYEQAPHTPDFEPSNGDRSMTLSDTGSQPSLTTPPDSQDEGDKDGLATRRVPSKNASTEEKIEFVLSCVEQVSFDSLESFITTFYAYDFEDASSLAFEQRMSRNRRLPLVMAELRKLSASWTRWESSGYENEVLRTAEEICGTECRDFSLQHAKSILLEAKASRGGTRSFQQKMLQDKLPHLSALLTSLSPNNISSSRRGDPNITTICLLLLSCSGQVNTVHTASLLNACMSFVERHACPKAAQ